jgi:hypothetical protein
VNRLRKVCVRVAHIKSEQQPVHGCEFGLQVGTLAACSTQNLYETVRAGIERHGGLDAAPLDTARTARKLDLVVEQVPRRSDFVVPDAVGLIGRRLVAQTQ